MAVPRRDLSPESGSGNPAPFAPDTATALIRWQDHMRGPRRLAALTIRAYLDDTIRFLHFLAGHLGRPPSLNDLAALDLRDFRSWLASRHARRLDPASTARAISALRAFFTHLRREGLCDNKAIALLKSPKRTAPLPRPLSEAAAAKLTGSKPAGTGRTADWVAARDIAAIMLLYGAGLRISEALSLLCADIPVAAEQGNAMVNLRVKGKGGRERIVPLLPVIRKAITRYRRLCPWPETPQRALFLGVRGKRLRPEILQKSVRELRRGLGLPESVTPHALRHSFASHLLSASGDLRAVQELLGHASLSSTQRYTDVDAAALLETYDRAHPRGK